MQTKITIDLKACSVEELAGLYRALVRELERRQQEQRKRTASERDSEKTLR